MKKTLTFKLTSTFILFNLLTSGVIPWGWIILVILLDCKFNRNIKD